MNKSKKIGSYTKLLKNRRNFRQTKNHTRANQSIIQFVYVSLYYTSFEWNQNCNTGFKYPISVRWKKNQFSNYTLVLLTRLSYMKKNTDHVFDGCWRFFFPYIKFNFLLAFLVIRKTMRAPPHHKSKPICKLCCCLFFA